METRRKQPALVPHHSASLRIRRKKSFLLVLLMFTATISVSEILGADKQSVVPGPSATSLTNCGAPTVISLSQLESLTPASIIPDKRSLTPPCSVTSNSVTYPTYVELDRVTIEYAPYTGDCNAIIQSYCDVHLEFGCTISAGCLFEIDQTWFAAGYTYPVNTQGAGSVVPGMVVNATGFLYIDDHGIHELHPTVSVSVYGVPPPPMCGNGAIDPPICATCPSGYVLLNGICVIQPSSIAPVLILPGDQTLAVGSILNFTVNVTDASPAAVVILTVTGLPSGATFDSDTGIFYWIPGPNQVGSHVLTFSAVDKNNPSQQDIKPMNVRVVAASPGGSGGGAGGSKGNCLSCVVLPVMSSTWGLLVVGGLLGLVGSLALLTIRTRSDLKSTRRRVKQMSGEN